MLFVFSARLLSQQPFLNLVLTCAQGEELDNLVSSLLRHIQAIINRVKEVCVTHSKAEILFLTALESNTSISGFVCVGARVFVVEIEFSVRYFRLAARQCKYVGDLGACTFSTDVLRGYISRP